MVVKFNKFGTVCLLRGC